MIEEEDAPLTFSDEDFERRYSSEEAASAPLPAARQSKPVAVQLARSRNRYMRTLLRRRFAASGPT
jgi:hypothetical protein